MYLAPYCPWEDCPRVVDKVWPHFLGWRSERWFEVHDELISFLSTSTALLQMLDATFRMSLGVFGMWSLLRDCFHSLPILNLVCPSLCCQLSLNHSSQAWFHSPSQPLNSSSNIHPNGHIEQVSLSLWPGGIIMTPKMTSTSYAEISSSTVLASGSVTPLLCLYLQLWLVKFH